MLLNIGETGSVTVANTINGGSTASVTFNNTYSNPIVITQLVGGPAFTVARAKDITANSATIFIQEDSGAAITAGSYEISYLVIEKGTYILDSGHILEAGYLNTTASHSSSANDGWAPVAIEGSFADPLVLHSPNSYNSGNFFATTVKDVTRAGFDVTREIATNPTDNTVSEKIGYLVLEKSQGKTKSFVRYHTGSVENSHNVSAGEASVGFDGNVFVSGQELNGADGFYGRVSPTTQTDRWRFVAKGNSSTYAELPGIYDENGTRITSPYRSYNVSVLDVATNTFDEHVSFDVYGNKPSVLTQGQMNCTSVADVAGLYDSTISIDTSLSRGGNSSFRVDASFTTQNISGIILTPKTYPAGDTIARAEGWVLMPVGVPFKFGIRYNDSSGYHSTSTSDFVGTGEWQLCVHQDDTINSGATFAGVHCFVIGNVGDPTVRFWLDDSQLVTHTNALLIRNAQSMANYLYNLPRNGEKRVVVISNDEPQDNRLSGQLDDAMYDIGASKAVYGGTFMHRSAYLLVGEPGISEGNALVELYAGDIDSDPDAYIDYEFFLTNKFNAYAEEPSIRDGAHAVEKIAFAVFDTGNLSVNDNDYVPVYDPESLYTYGGEPVTYQEYTMISVGTLGDTSAVGTPRPARALKPSDFVDESSVSTPTVAPQAAYVGSVGIASTSVVGTGATALPQPAYVTGIGWEASEFGNQTVSPQPVTLNPEVIFGGEVLDPPLMLPQPVQLTATGIPTEEYLEVQEVHVQPVTATPVGFDAGSQAGTNIRVSLNPDAIGIISAERVMETAQVLPQPVTLGVSAGIPTEEAMGISHDVLPQPVTMYVVDFINTEFGEAQINMRIKNAGNIGLERGIDQYYDAAEFQYGDFEHYYIDELGGHSVKSVVRLDAQGFENQSEFGVGSVAYGVTPEGIPTGEVFGDVVALQSVLIGQGIPSEEAVGTPFRVTNTFIKSRIRDFDEELWTTLFEKEQYCYDQTVQQRDPATYGSETGGTITVPGRDVYEPKFQALQQAIYAWLDIDRKAPFKNFMNGLYSYIIFNKMYATDGSLLAASYAAQIFNMDGFVTRIKLDPESYYHDYSESCTWDDVEMTTTCTDSTPNLDADIALISNAYDNQELPDMESLTSQYQDVVSTKTHDLMFTDYPILEVVNKDQMTNIIFVDMEYKRIYDSMNVGLDLPPNIPRPVAEAA